MPQDIRPIGIFDSGIGGLTVTAHIRQALRRERLIYFGDSVNLPYGQRSLEQVRQLSTGITRALLQKDCKMIVVACNTASGAALHSLRQHFPHMPFVGMEPAVKPAAEQTRTRTVGVIATPATFQSEVYASVVERFAQDVTVLHQPCPGLVGQIEAGEFETERTENMVRAWLEPMLAQHIDVLVLGCTHYPIIQPLIERIVGPAVRVIDPAPAIARQVERLLEQHQLHAPEDAHGSLTCYTSGSIPVFKLMLSVLQIETIDVHKGSWLPNGNLSLP